MIRRALTFAMHFCQFMGAGILAAVVVGSFARTARLAYAGQTGASLDLVIAWGLAALLVWGLRWVIARKKAPKA